MEFSYLNKLELMSEVTMLFFNYFLFLFTDFIGDVKTRYQVGKFFIYFTLLMIAINMMFISISLYIDTKYEYKVKKAQKAWKKFKKLKVKMATFIIVKKRSELKSLLGEDFTPKRRKQVKRMLGKFSYKDMEL